VNGVPLEQPGAQPLNRDNIARELCWWKDPSDVTEMEWVRRVMELGTWEMVCFMNKKVDRSVLLQAIHTANPGDFSLPSWHYWHCVLGEPSIGELPKRHFGKTA